MRYAAASKVKVSDFAGNEFIRLNNCGAFIDTDRPVTTDRPHGRKDYQLIYIKRGALCARLDGADQILRAGTVLLYRPAEPQIYRTAESGTTYFWIHFTGSLPAELLAFLRGHICKVGAFPEFEEFCTLSIRAFAERRTGYRTLCGGRLITLCALLEQRCASPSIAPYNKAVDRVAHYIQAHCAENADNDEYAAMAGLSKSHFIRAFTRQTGLSPQNYRTAVRMETAKALLCEGDLRISEIAAHLGYDDPLYFSRVFKKQTGLSPREYTKK